MLWEQQLAEQLAERAKANLMRERRVLQSAQSAHIQLNNRDVLNFCSNDYLGLANDPRVKAAFIAGVEKYGVGSGASHLVIGHSTVHHALEDALADFCGRERAVLFSSGFAANLGVLTALLTEKDAVFEDKLNHASLLDGGLFSGARFQRYLHNDVQSLRQRLHKSDARHKLIVTDGVFSMDGDVAPLAELAQAAADHNAAFMVDDAHGFGVLGKTGAGSVEAAGLSQQQVPILMATLGKAAGVQGAFVSGSAVLVETLIQFARTYIYTTAIPPASAAAALKSLEIIQQEPWRREHVLNLVQRFRKGAAALGLNLMDSYTPIQPVLIGAAEDAVRWSNALAQQNILISAIRPPTVAAGTSRLRITFSAQHSEADVDRLLSVLGEIK
ncbi:MAG TPA: 8-amino-7-oxononanoate synthase [Pseudomonadales bacterium]|nr:8-amino-7-oxononanoate synthase [Pseudomonadales bacterium]